MHNGMNIVGALVWLSKN